MPTFRTLVRLHYLRHSFDATDLAKGLHDRGQIHYLGQITFRLLKVSMRPAEANLLNQIIDIEGADISSQQIRTREVHGRWLVSVLGITKNPEVRRLETWSNRTWIWIRTQNLTKPEIRLQHFEQDSMGEERCAFRENQETSSNQGRRREG